MAFQGVEGWKTEKVVVNLVIDSWNCLSSFTSWLWMSETLLCAWGIFGWMAVECLLDTLLDINGRRAFKTLMDFLL